MPEMTDKMVEARSTAMKKQKADIAAKRGSYARTCRRFTGHLDPRVQHMKNYYGEGYPAGTYPVPIGQRGDFVAGVGYVCPECAAELAISAKKEIPESVESQIENLMLQVKLLQDQKKATPK